jgi:protein TonB
MAEQLAVKPFDEIVFEHRNKEYGAYELRKRYNKHMNTAFIIAISVFVISVSIPAIMDFLDTLAPIEADTNVELTLVDAPPLDKDVPPPPPPPDPPPPVQETIKFTPPVVTEEPIDEKDIPPPQDEIKVQVGTETKEGTGDIELPTEGDGKEEVEAPQQIFTIVEQMPEFPGGEEELFKYLGKNIKYPSMARENGITGTVYVTFVVEGNGEISDVKKLRGIGGGCDEEAMRVVKAMPSWKAGKQNGKSVRVQYNLPIKFTLR